jgi:hypothetical protein
MPGKSAAHNIWDFFAVLTKNTKMKTKLIVVLLLAFASRAQEFTVYENGLIYTPGAVSKLKHIVDSLNLKFKACDVSKTFQSLDQCRAHYVLLEGHAAHDAHLAVQKGLSYEGFRKQYPKAKVEENLVATKDFEAEDGRRRHYVYAIEMNGWDSHYISSEMTKSEMPFQPPFKGRWIVDYQPKTPYSPESLSGFYFPEEFAAKPIPARYATWIQYADCLIDTTARVLHDRAGDTRFRYYDSVPGKPRLFVDYVEKTLKMPRFDAEDYDILFGFDTLDYDRPGRTKRMGKKERRVRDAKAAAVEAGYKRFHERMDKWLARRLVMTDSLKAADPRFMEHLNDAYAEALEKQNSSEFFEQYVEWYLSKEKALDLKRSRRVVGGCSMDTAPRQHAFSIALLSAETTKWDIFLRAHLDIMNDRFDRVSDGSYAWAERQTYIKELEVLDINVADLMLGISLRAGNTAKNHYFSSIGRAGRALAESSETARLETEILAMIADAGLDDINRIMMYHLFRNYNESLGDDNVKISNRSRLAEAVATLPPYIRSRTRP